MVGRQTHERTYLVSITLIALATFFVSLLWLLALPHFEGPDEHRHYNSVARLVDGGGWPKPYNASIRGSTWQALGESGWGLTDGQYVDPLPEATDRSGFLGPTDLSASGHDQMVQHPPGYYVLGAVAVSAAGGDSLRWDQASLLLGALSAGLSAGAIPFIGGTVRRATGSRWAGVLGATFPLLIPSYTALGSRISNDALLIVAVSATTYGLVRAWAEPRARTWMLMFAGVSYGIALGTKGYALMFAPVVVILATLAAWQAKRRLWSMAWRLLVAAAIAFAIGGWWWVRNLIILGKLQPSQLGGRERLDVATDGYSFPEFVSTFFPRLNATFWDRAGYVYAGEQGGLLLLTGGLSLLLIVIAASIFTHSRLTLAILLIYPVVITTTLFVNAHGIYWDTGDPTRGIQGRYLYSGMAVFSLAFASVVHRVVGFRSLAAKFVSTSLIGVAALSGLVYSMLVRVPLTWQARDDRTPASIGDPSAFMDASLLVWGAICIAACTSLLCGLFFGARVASHERGRFNRRSNEDAASLR